MPSRLLRNSKLGLFTPNQFHVLKFRSEGLTQVQTARALGTSRANVSMIELRARRKLGQARDTIRAYESVLSSHSVEVKKGTRLQQIPELVLHEGDRYGIHLQSNIVDIIRMVKSLKPPCVASGTTSSRLLFTFSQRGKLSVSPYRHSVLKTGP